MSDTTIPTLPALALPVTTSLRSGRHDLAITDIGTGPTVLLVHVGMTAAVWAPVVDRLRDHHRVVTFDAPGNGHTGGDPQVELTDAAQAVDDVVRHLELDDVVLAFHDLGGPAALHAAAGWPKRIRALAAVNTFGWRPSGLAFRGMLALMASAPMRGLDVATGWLPAATSTRNGVGRHLDADGRKAFRALFPADARRAFHRYLHSARTHDYRRVEESVAALADRPLVTVFGERNDPLGFQPQWQERFDDVTQLVVPGGNHFPMCDDPALVANAIRGLARR